MGDPYETGGVPGNRGALSGMARRLNFGRGNLRVSPRGPGRIETNKTTIDGSL